jgi:hypothetical protein
MLSEIELFNMLVDIDAALLRMADKMAVLQEQREDVIKQLLARQASTPAHPDYSKMPFPS